MASSPQPITCFGPDFPFDYTAWLDHPDGLLAVPEGDHGDEVAVIGAGIAGVVAAHELMKLGLRPVVFEAGRMGGRLRSQRFGAADDVIAELGGMRFPRSGTTFFRYVDELDLATRPFPNPLTPAAPTTVIDLAGETLHAETLDDLPPLFREVADAWSEALEDHAGFSELQDAMRVKDHDRVRTLWAALVDQWDER
ncbi:MAG: FAD-dependent oxidoreductase, partial [Actinomycetota bacterium]